MVNNGFEIFLREDKPDWVWDKFQQTPPMSTFSVGLVVSEFSNIDYNTTDEENNWSIGFKN